MFLQIVKFLEYDVSVTTIVVSITLIIIGIVWITILIRWLRKKSKKKDLHKD